MARTKFLFRFQARIFHGAVPQQVEQSAAEQPEGRPHQGLETGRVGDDDDGACDGVDEGLSHVAGQEGKGDPAAVLGLLRGLGGRLPVQGVHGLAAHPAGHGLHQDVPPPPEEDPAGRGDRHPQLAERELGGDNTSMLSMMSEDNV